MTTVCCFFVKRKVGVKRGFFFRTHNTIYFIQEVRGGEAEVTFPQLYQDIQFARNFAIEVSESQWRTFQKLEQTAGGVH